jgi:hypothetical protein
MSADEIMLSFLSGVASRGQSITEPLLYWLKCSLKPLRTLPKPLSEETVCDRLWHHILCHLGIVGKKGFVFSSRHSNHSAVQRQTGRLAGVGQTRASEN